MAALDREAARADSCEGTGENARQAARETPAEGAREGGFKADRKTGDKKPLRPEEYVYAAVRIGSRTTRIEVAHPGYLEASLKAFHMKDASVNWRT